MPVFAYPPEVKAKIIQVAKDARANERGWDEALMLAKNEGYKGSLGGLQQLIRNAEKPKAAQPHAAAKLKPGRPKKTAAAAVPSASVESVQAMIDAIVKKRLADAFAKVRAALDEAERSA
ncbi:MAG TPA: hypothetical protein VGP72_27715 [Planctomycetota bacterium]|jgi:hypothetical protein